MLTFLKKNIGLIIFSPLIINFLYNLLFSSTKNFSFKILDILSSILIFSFLFSIGKVINRINNKFSISFGIILYLLSFFLFEGAALLFYRDVDLKFTFFTVNIIWLIYFAYKVRKLTLYPILSFSLLNIFNSAYLDHLSKNVNITGDVKDVFLPDIIKIFEYSYYFSVNNPTMQGYPQFLSYFDALILQISLNTTEYIFLLSNSLLFFWLFSLIFYELNLSKINRNYIVFLFFTLIFNSDWLQFLFVSSLMSERIVSFFFFGILTTLFNNNNFSSKEINLILFSLGFLYLSKQFFSIIVIILFFIFFSKYKWKSGWLFSGFLFKELTFLTYFNGLARDHHIRQIDIFDTVLDLLLLRDLKIKNILGIANNIFIDKPVTYLLIIFFVVSLLIIFNFKASSYEIRVYSKISFINIFFVLVLYISAWRNMELESPVRYIYNFIPIYLPTIFLYLETINIKKNEIE